MAHDIRSLCREQYAARIAMRIDIPADLKRALKTHERVPAFIDNLSKALYKVPKDIKTETIIMAVHSLTDLFISNVMRKSDESRMSAMEKHRLLADEAKKAAARAWADEVVGEEKVTRNAEGHETASQTVHID